MTIIDFPKQLKILIATTIFPKQLLTLKATYVFYKDCLS
jgi:hypothetical protein